MAAGCYSTAKFIITYDRDDPKNQCLGSTSPAGALMFLPFVAGCGAYFGALVVGPPAAILGATIAFPKTALLLGSYGLYQYRKEPLALAGDAKSVDDYEGRFDGPGP